MSKDSWDWRILFTSALCLFALGMVSTGVGYPPREPVLRIALWLWSISMVVVFVLHYRLEALQTGRNLWAEEIWWFGRSVFALLIGQLMRNTFRGQPNTFDTVLKQLPWILAGSIILWTFLLKLADWRLASKVSNGAEPIVKH
jgi:hypothetical protein